MNNQKTRLVLAMGMLLGGAALTSQAAMLNAGDRLTINAGVPVYDGYGNQMNISSGSWFALEGDNNSRIAGVEKVALTPGESDIVIGQTSAPGSIDSWSFYYINGSHWLPSPIPPGGTTNGLDFSGWSMYWNDIDMPLGGGAWDPLNCGTLGSPCSFTSGVAAFAWNGVYGDSYSLWYTATVPLGNISGFGGVQYMLHLEGTVMSAVPVPAAGWLFGSGSIGLLGVARRRRAS